MRFVLFLTLLVFSPPLSADEPSLAQTRDAALSYAGLDGPNTDRWSTRARLRNLLPKVTGTVGLGHKTDDTTRFDEWLTHGPDDELLWDSAKNQTGSGSQRDIDYTIRAEIDLGGLLFDPYELAAAREARARHANRLALIQAVHLAWFERREALRAPATDAEAVDELEAELDGLTGGWFTGQLRGAP